VKWAGKVVFFKNDIKIYFLYLLHSKTVAELKMRFPSLQQNLQVILASEMDKVCREETFLKEEPERLDIALKRCKKLTGTLVTLKR
jgi:SRC kinase signaling inhibitor 1